MAQSAISLCSKALIKLGAHPIISFTENTAEAQVALQLYEATRDALLSSYPWHFATAQEELSLLRDAPCADYAYAYRLPNDFLRALSAGVNSNGKGLNYRIYERTLHCDSKNVVLTYIFNPKEENYPPFFDYVLILKLAAEFCFPLTENSSKAKHLEQMAKEAFNQAKLIDAQQNLPQTINHFPLIEVR